MTMEPHPHFLTLQRKINARLLELATEHALAQIQNFPWLYGALGAVPAPVMFICENPSLRGVRRADVTTLDGGPPDIEAQWCGGPTSVARKRFRRVLVDAGLKSTPEGEKGGWGCYITNVAKEANIVADQGGMSNRERRVQAEHWAPILAWEIEAVAPNHIFCVGNRATTAVRWLQRRRLIPRFPVHSIWHYSARGGDESVRERMRSGIAAVLGEANLSVPRPQPPEQVPLRMASPESPPLRKPEENPVPPAGARHWIQELWQQDPPRAGARSKYLGKVIMRKPEWESRNPRLGSRRGAGFYAFEVGISGITTEEYGKTLEELWRLRPDLNQKEQKLQLWKHLAWDLERERKHVQLVEYDAPGVEEARAANGLPSLAGPGPAGYTLVKRELIEEIVGGRTPPGNPRRPIRF